MANKDYQPMNIQHKSDVIIPNQQQPHRSDDIENKLLTSNEIVQQVGEITQESVTTTMIVIDNGDRFVCAGGCRRTFKHNNRTRAEKAAGIQNIYCKACKVQQTVNDDLTCFACMACLFCSCICGIPAIIYARDAQTALSMGDIEGYREANKQAKLWIGISVITGLILMIVWFIFNFS